MFPAITRDDVFRIETPRLWLRWPDMRDVSAIRSYASRAEVAEMTASIPHPYPEEEAAHFVGGVRERNGRGETLELLIERKAPDRAVIGTVLSRCGQDQNPSLGYALHPDFWGHGYASEAAKALIDAVFLLTEAEAMTAIVRSDNAVSRHVLSKLGFAMKSACSKFYPLRNAFHGVEEHYLARETYHTQFGGDLHPLIWMAPYNGVEWAGAA